MKESIIKVILSFSLILPGANQFVNKDWQKGFSFSLSAAVGLIMFIFGGEKVSLLGFFLMLLTWVTNSIDVIDRALRPIIQDLHKIAVFLERMPDRMEIMAVYLKQIADALPEIRAKLTALNEERKLLPPRKEFPLLSPPKSGKVIFLPGAVEKKEELEEKSRVT